MAFAHLVLDWIVVLLWGAVILPGALLIVQYLFAV